VNIKGGEIWGENFYTGEKFYRHRGGGK